MNTGRTDTCVGVGAVGSAYLASEEAACEGGEHRRAETVLLVERPGPTE